MARFIDDDIRVSIESSDSFKTALLVLNQIPQYAENLQNPVVDRFSEVVDALTQGIFDEELSSQLEELYRPIEEHQKIMEVLGDSLVRPEHYEKLSETLLPISDFMSVIDRSKVVKNMTEGLSCLTSAMQSVIDTTWLHEENIWEVAKEALSVIDTEGLGNDTLSNLVRLEHDTSLLPGLEVLTSAASQIVSIQEASRPQSQMAQILSDYIDFAANQHRAIQRMYDDEEEKEWRLNALDAASKLVDRQMKWSEAIIDTVPDMLEEDETIDYPSIISILPQHIAYSKKKNVLKTPEDALESSSLIEITEKGKTISERIILINKFCEDSGNKLIFKYTTKAVEGMLHLSSMVCTTIEQMGRIIDVLYFIFYENIERMKSFIGGGDKAIGDQKIRNEEIYQCIFNVKTIRSDLRHDLDHGKDKEIRKKFMDIGECYRHYCKKRPLKAKDFRLLQLRLYDEFISLTDMLLEML